jgi:hypothetical protein
MTSMRGVVLGALAAVLVVACSGGDDNGAAKGNTPGATIEGLNPPANINVQVCSSIEEAEFELSDECRECCNDNAYDASSEFDGRCICGNERVGPGGVSCEGQTASGEVCGACCTDAGFSGHSWVGGSGFASCSCFGQSDAKVCAAALEESDPAQACRVCCLNQGYLGMGYTGIGTPECRCVG